MNIKSLRFDRSDEYLSGDFDKYLLDNRILSQLLAPGMTQKNSVAERRNQTFLYMLRSMMSYSYLPNFLWGYTLQIMTYILNSMSTKSVQALP